MLKEMLSLVDIELAGITADEINEQDEKLPLAKDDEKVLITELPLELKRMGVYLAQIINRLRENSGELQRQMVLHGVRDESKLPDQFNDLVSQTDQLNYMRKLIEMILWYEVRNRRNFWSAPMGVRRGWKVVEYKENTPSLGDLLGGIMGGGNPPTGFYSPACHQPSLNMYYRTLLDLREGNDNAALKRLERALEEDTHDSLAIHLLDRYFGRLLDERYFFSTQEGL